jgi:hypothetical protein
MSFHATVLEPKMPSAELRLPALIGGAGTFPGSCFVAIGIGLLQLN